MGYGPSPVEINSEKQPTTIHVCLRPQDAKLAYAFKPGTVVSMAVRGEVSNISLGEYGSSFDLAVDMIAFKEPSPEKFVDELNAVRVSAEE